MRGHCSRLLFQRPNRPALPRHGLKAEGVPSAIPPGEKRPVCPLFSKWQIGLGWRQKVARREPERSAASAKRAVTTHRGIPKGTALGVSLPTFSTRESRPGFGAERPKGGCWGCQPRINLPRVQGGAPAYRGVQGLPAGATSRGSTSPATSP